MTNDHDLGEGMEECTVCHKKHPKAFMAKHMKNRHSEKPGRFHCEMCDKTCTTEEGLDLHKTIHSGFVFIFYQFMNFSQCLVYMKFILTIFFKEEMDILVIFVVNHSKL